MVMIRTLKGIILVFGLSFALITAVGITSVKDNFVFAQAGNATLNLLGNNSAVGPTFEELSEKLSQIAGKLGINTTLGSAVSKANITAFLKNLQSNEAFSNLKNESGELVNRSGMNLTELSGDQTFNVSELAEKFVQLLSERPQNQTQTQTQ